MLKKNATEIVFISDLHLQETASHITQIFLKLLSASSLHKLYILGDLFEVWIGDDDKIAFNQLIIAALHAATKRGVEIYFQHGNRDFLIGEKFAAATGCKLLDTAVELQLDNQKILIMHGDTLCTADKAYLRARKWMHSKLLKTLFLLSPIRFRKHIAKKLRQKSSQYTKITAPQIMDVTAEAVDQVMNDYQVKWLVHGHTHRPAIHELTHNRKRIVLGAWHDRAEILAWSSANHWQLISCAEWLAP